MINGLYFHDGSLPCRPSGNQSHYGPQVERSIAGKARKKWYHSRNSTYTVEESVENYEEYCCHIWAGVAQSLLSILDRVQNSLRGFVRDKVFPLYNTFPTTQKRKILQISNIKISKRKFRFGENDGC